MQKLLKQKRAAVALGILIIALSIILVTVVGIAFFTEDSTEDMVRMPVSFSSYEIKHRTKSTAYDLLLISEEHELPFKLNFFDGYKGIVEAEELCTGSVYTVEVLPAKSNYVIYSCCDENGKLIMSKRQAYLASQTTAGIILIFMFIGCISVGVLYIFIAFRPEWISEKMRKRLMGTWGK